MGEGKGELGIDLTSGCFRLIEVTKGNNSTKKKTTKAIKMTTTMKKLATKAR